MRVRLGSLLTFVGWCLASCGGARRPPDVGASRGGGNCGDRSGGSEIGIQVKDETFHFWTDEATFVARAKLLKASGESGTVLFGQLLDGGGRDTQWTFHVATTDLHWQRGVVEGLEGCDASPSEIERDKRHWVEEVKRWCPLHARVLVVEDCL